MAEGEVYRLAMLVARMRAKQVEYFKTRSSAVLGEAKDLEKQVDRAVEWVLLHRESVSDNVGQKVSDNVGQKGGDQ